MVHPILLLLTSSCLCRKSSEWFKPFCFHRISLTHKSTQASLSFYDLVHLLCHQDDSRSFSLADFFRQKAWTHSPCPANSLNRLVLFHLFFWLLATAQLILVAQNLLFGVRGPASRLEHSHCLGVFSSIIGLGPRAKAIHQLFSRQSLLITFQLISLTPFFTQDWWWLRTPDHSVSTRGWVVVIISVFCIGVWPFSL